MGKKKRIKKPKANAGSRVSPTENIANYDARPPIFSLERLQPGDYCLQSLNNDGKASFADSIFKRKAVTWNDLKSMDRHALGFEKIDKKAIKKKLPRFITEDVKHLLAFRYDGMKPMVGYRVKNVFFVLWFDHDFTLYNH